MSDAPSEPFVPPERFNIAEYFLEARLEEGLGDRVALRTDDGELSYAETAALARRCGGGLRRLGVRQEERVVVALRDGAEFVASLFGILRIGGVVVMVNPDLDEDALARLLDYVRPSVAIVEAEVLETFTAASGRFPRELLVVGDSGGHPGWDETVSDAGEVREMVSTHRDDAAIWLFSGGTTGRPKAVVQTHRSFANTTELYAKRAVGYRRDDVTVSVPKLYFGYATGSNLLFPFAVGATACLFRAHPTPEVLFERIERQRPTILVTVPTMIGKMLDHPGAEEHDLSSLRFATSAGEALPVPLHERWDEVFGVELLDGLGTAEMWHIFITNRPGGVRRGTLGRVVEGFEIRVCDEEGREVPDGETGRLWVRGDSRAICYWQNLEKTAEAFRGEWFVGGDLVSRAPDGRVTYRGRADDVMKVSGKWCAPGEIEACLLEHDDVAEAAVIGVSDDDGLTKPVAFVATERTDEGLAEELKRWVLERLAPYKHPRRVVRLDSLPRTHLGKVDRGALQEMA